MDVLTRRADGMCERCILPEAERMPAMCVGDRCIHLRRIAAQALAVVHLREAERLLGCKVRLPSDLKLVAAG